jgi:transmembrane 9 superfamily protein 2/4
MGDAKMCNVLCRKTLDSKTAKAFKEKIDDEYRVNMYETLFLGVESIY